MQCCCHRNTHRVSTALTHQCRKHGIDVSHLRWHAPNHLNIPGKLGNIRGQPPVHCFRVGLAGTAFGRSQRHNFEPRVTLQVLNETLTHGARRSQHPNAIALQRRERLRRVSDLLSHRRRCQCLAGAERGPATQPDARHGRKSTRGQPVSPHFSSVDDFGGRCGGERVTRRFVPSSARRYRVTSR